MLSKLLSKKKPYFGRYEGEDDNGRSAYLEFELGQTGSWIYRFGRVGFPPVGEKIIGTDDADVENKILSIKAIGYQLADEDEVLPTEQNDSVMMGFHSWLASKGKV